MQINLAKADLHLLFFWSFEEEEELFIVPALLRRAVSLLSKCDFVPPLRQHSRDSPLTGGGAKNAAM